MREVDGEFGALTEEILDRITAIQELCGTLSMAQLDDADPRSAFRDGRSGSAALAGCARPESAERNGRPDRAPANYGCPQSC